MKRRFLAVVSAFSGMFTPFVVPAVAPVHVEAAQPVLSIGTRGTAVAQLQAALNRLGFSCGAVDGVFGPQTRAAVIAFQRAHHLTADGVVGPQTWSALNNAFAVAVHSVTPVSHAPGVPTSSAASSTAAYPGRPLQVGSTGSAVRMVQQRLNALGYNCGAVDGIFGTSTYKAVTSFQRAHGLTVDGVVGPATWAKLFAPASHPAPAPNPAPAASYQVYLDPIQPPQTAQSLNDVKAMLTGHPKGFAVNASDHTIVQMPAHYYHDQNGRWVDEHGNSAGWAPDFGQSGFYYIPLGNPPLNQYERFAQDAGGKVVFTGLQRVGTFVSVDLNSKAPASVTADVIDRWLSQHNASGYVGPSPLTGLGASFVAAQETYGVNAVYLLAHAILESKWGNSQIAIQNNNLFGYGAYDANPGQYAGVFPSQDYAIRFQGWEIHSNYLGLGESHYGGSPTLGGMLQGGYATDPTWAQGIAALMDQFVQQNGGSVLSYPQYSGTPPKLSPSAEPVYYMQGATGHVLGPNDPSFPNLAPITAAYGGLPVYADVTDGEQTMYICDWQEDDRQPYPYPAVALIQRTLNRVVQHKPHGNLTVDGEFGSMTRDTVAEFQRENNLTAARPGVVDFITWQALMGKPTSLCGALAPGTPVSIQEILQGMSNGVVTEWYYVTGTSTQGQRISGWVNSDYIQFDNVYRIAPEQPGAYTVRIAGQALHAGDYVVSNDGHTILFCDAQGRTYQGSVDGLATLKKIGH